MSFLTSFFTQPLMLFGTLLIGVPIIIYLINRQRFQRRKWAAMEFLLRAMRKNQRRIQLENLLLLLIRCAIIALLAAAMARPFIRDRVLGNTSNQPQNWIFSIDTSYSMGLSSGTRSLFETARESVSKIVQNLVKRGDRVAVVTMGTRPGIVVSPRAVTDASRGEILQAISDLRLGYEPVNLASSFRLVLDVAREFEAVPGAETAFEGKKLILFSDFQRKDWLVESRPRDPTVNELFSELERAGVLMSRADLRGTDRNFAVTGLTMSPPIASQGVWVEFFATVKNFGNEDFDAVEVLFRVDDVEQPSQLMRLPAGGTLTRTLRYRFREPGAHVVSVEARIDDLSVDNTRSLVVDVRESADVLLVDGEPGLRAIDRETLLLELALLPDDSDEFRRTPYNPILRSVDQLGAEDLELDANVAVVLANVAASDLPVDFVDALGRYVADGGALLVFLGKNVVPEEYNETFTGGERALMPLRLEDVSAHESEPVHLRFVDEQHPVASYFLRRAQYSYLEKPYIEFRRFLRFADPAEGAPLAQLMRFDDPRQSLAAFDTSVGEGRVLWFTSSADLDWNDFGKYPDFIPFVHEMIPYLVGFGESRMNLVLGEAYRQIFEARDYSPRVLIIPPRGLDDGDTGAAAIPKQMRREGERFVLGHEETNTPGVYEIRLASASGPGNQDRRSLFAVNLDASEGDLTRVSREELTQHFPDLKSEVFDAAEKIEEISSNRDAATGTELWRTVLWLVLALLATESVLAMFFGRSLR